MAGAVGFEPTVHDTKNRCLTTWLRPNYEDGAEHNFIASMNQVRFFKIWGISSPKPPERGTPRRDFLVYAIMPRAPFFQNR